MRSRPLPAAIGSKLAGPTTGGEVGVRGGATAAGGVAEGGRSPPRNVQETARNLDGCASVHRTVGRLKTLPWVAAACAPSLRDSTVTGSSTPPYHTPSRRRRQGSRSQARSQCADPL